MSGAAAADPESRRPSGGGRLADNVAHFARLLRSAGLPIGTDRILLSLRALRLAGLGRREDFRAVLAACLLDGVEQIALFDEAFRLYWEDPALRSRTLGSRAAVDDAGVPDTAQSAASRRLARALAEMRRPQRVSQNEERTRDATASASMRESLAKADFDSMSREEWDEARRAIAEWRTRLPRVRSRRFAPSSRGTRPDWRRIAADSARHGGDIAEIARRSPRWRATPLVALVDISGSMSRYSRTFLHFLHAFSGAPHRTHAFLFGTRLTSVTRLLRHRDPDVAIDACVRAVDDWSGGTRIGACLREFNVHWARRVLGQNATVLLVTDGLEREDAAGLAFEAERLSRSCHRLLWLNPLLRYDAFEPRAAGVRAIVRHVDAHLPVHDLHSLGALSQAIAALGRHPRSARKSI